MKDKSIVWGACWFNETIETVTNFYINTTAALKLIGLKVYPVVFAAKLEHDNEELKYLSDNVEDILILPNSTNIFPNKNYGVAAIAEAAHRLNSDYTAVVDPDWSIDEFESFVTNILKPIMDNNADIVIPDIVSAAGRSNLFLGKTAISLFYPEYLDAIKTAFPGSFVALTDKIYEIVTSESYHFDWGGEWDIISLAINKNMKIVSMPVEVVNMRHRPNTSKIFDAFQIWRAILSNEDIPTRFNCLREYTNTLLPYNEFSLKMLCGRYSALEQIDMVNKYATTDTERQLLYMILYPLAMLLGEIKSMPTIEKSTKTPYSKEEIHNVSKLAIYCAQSALLCSGKTLDEVRQRAKLVTKEFWSDWDTDSQKDAMKKINEILGGLV